MHLVTCTSVLLQAHFPTWMEMHQQQFCVHKKSCIQKILIYEGLFVASTIQISSSLVSSLLTTWLETPKPTKTTKKMMVGQLVLSWKRSNYQTKRWGAKLCAYNAILITFSLPIINQENQYNLFISCTCYIEQGKHLPTKVLECSHHTMNDTETLPHKH